MLVIFVIFLITLRKNKYNLLNMKVQNNFKQNFIKNIIYNLYALM